MFAIAICPNLTDGIRVVSLFHMEEGTRASGIGGTGAASGALMWALERLGVTIPDWLAFATVVGSATFLLIALVCFVRMGASRLRSKGRKRLGQWLMTALGAISIIVGISTISYAWVWLPHESKNISAVIPAQTISPTTDVLPLLPKKGGDINLPSNIVAGDGSQNSPGGNVKVEAGTGYRGASGGNVSMDPGTIKAGDAGSGGKGGDITIKAGDAR